MVDIFMYEIMVDNGLQESHVDQLGILVLGPSLARVRSLCWYGLVMYSLSPVGLTAHLRTALCMR
ncbi:hypothetical protein DPMN_135451 [Dreissena polymorpha]|uniref:Uncharacterized protein n=1 Tax=Dreissena polymorpha TaxID=45954 RepID=A0A9D4G1W4_DREPO|nr:hypothetical protein DPMN_135451 [Dreissena polymorpha]